MNKPESGPGTTNQHRPDWRQRAVLGVGILTVVLASGFWIYKAVVARHDRPEKAAASSNNPPERREEQIKTPPRMSQDPHGISSPKFTAPKPAESFLESFGKDDSVDDGDKSPAPANDKLLTQWQALEKSRERLLVLEERLNAARATKDEKPLKDVAKRLSELSEETNQNVQALEKELRRARVARSRDPVPQWLSGELLMFVRGEPELILPYFKRAGDRGLDSARLWASRSRVQLVANQMEAAYRSALNALERDSKDRHVWEAFTPAAFAVEQFAQVAERLTAAYGGRPPVWGEPMLNDAVELSAHWNIEQSRRKAEEKAGDLPRVRLTIEHRRFKMKNGKTSGKVESTGTEEVILELFEDEAPATVANFLTLVSQRFYDETKFYLSYPGQLVAAGCPRTKNADPADDGSGGPGYTIPDEFESPKARRHFRGALAMANTGPNSAGSRFFITLVPQPRMDGHFTVFGRVITGQEAVERITQGRTHPEVARFGRIIPGDLIVRAEVIRKRPHEYRVIKTGSGS
jgi:peptidyl-prolyl cis-trans isomerase B (cyclophilin B)